MNNHLQELREFEEFEELDEIKELQSASHYRQDRPDPFILYNHHEFFKRFQFTKATVRFIYTLVERRLKKPVYRHSVPPMLQLLIALRYFASNSFQVAVADVCKVSQSTVCRIVHRVAIALALLRPMFIKFPQTDEAPRVRQMFQQAYGFPETTGCIGCTHVQILSPGGSEAEVYKNWKGVHSLKVQVVCGPELEITYIGAKWYGSSPSSFIFDNSKLKALLEAKTAPPVLLGDSGYPCLPYLMTPIANPQTPEEERYNLSFIPTQAMIMRLFSIWKKKFPILRYMRTNVKNSITIIVAVAVLYNIAQGKGEIHDNDDDDETNTGEDDVEDEGDSYPCNTVAGIAMRRALIQTHFI